MKKIRLPLGRSSYTISIGSRLLSRAPALAGLRRGTDAVVITNARLGRLYGRTLSRALARRGIAVRFEYVPDSERAKSLPVAGRVLASIARHDTLRRTVIIALGGGVVGDLAGFVAAVYKRGIPYVQIPTTLLAQVDSSIGGKTAVDLSVAKNLVGAFHQPVAVIADVDLLRSLPKRQLSNGLAEVIKYGVIKDRALFSYLEKNIGRILRRDGAALSHVIERCAAIKTAVVSRDERDTKGVRAILNYGHTIGHAIEAASGYAGEFMHGEAVAIGMVAAADIAVRLGMIGSGEQDRIEALIRRAGLPVACRGVRQVAVKRALLHDKKFVNRKNRFVLPTTIGSVRLVEGVPARAVADAIRKRLAPQKRGRS